MNLKSEKHQLMETRREMKKQAIIQKNNINLAFDKMKAKGKMDPRVMEKLGIGSSGSRAASVASVERGSQMSTKPMSRPKMIKKVPEPRRGRTERNPETSKSVAQYNAISAKKNVDELRKRFNDELLRILEIEQGKENLREETLRNVVDVEEAMKMEKKFGLERAKAS